MTPFKMICVVRNCVLAVLLSCAIGAAAQTPPTSGAKPANEKPATNVTPLIIGDYVLGADDIIEINVANHSDLTKQHIIRADGKITVSELGEIQAAGKTPRQLADEIQAGYDKKLNNADVSIDVRESHSRRVSISSSNNGLRSAGSFTMQPNMHLMDLITVAGGLNVKPDRVTGKVVRGGTQVMDLDLVRANAQPLSEANILLQPNDLVLLDAKNPLAEEIYVIGAVARPGHFPLTEQTTLISVLSEAGVNTDSAALTKAYILRKGVKMPIDLRPALKLGKSDPIINDFKLEIGDEIFIPEIENRYAVMGQVAKPSYYFIPEKGPINVLEALNLAGGQLATGDLSKAGIIREVDGKATVIQVNLNTVQKKPQAAYDFKMQPEDILYVPPRSPRGFVWQDVLTPISTLSFLGFRLFH
jgi:polysaccharide export outer membrane protein